jgi:hypothetical protein
VFLSKEKVDDKFKRDILAFSEIIGKLEETLHSKDRKQYVKTVDSAIKLWFTFYSNYAGNPPAPWIKSKVWLDELGDITGRMALIKKMDFQKEEKKIHGIIAGINQDLVTIFKNSTKLSEKEIVESILKLLNEIKSENLTDGEKIVKKNNIKTLTELLLCTHQSGISNNLLDEYLANKKKIADNLLKLVSMPKISDTQMGEIINKLTEFQKYRKEILKKSWF